MVQGVPQTGPATTAYGVPPAGVLQTGVSPTAVPGVTPGFDIAKAVTPQVVLASIPPPPPPPPPPLPNPRALNMSGMTLEEFEAAQKDLAGMERAESIRRQRAERDMFSRIEDDQARLRKEHDRMGSDYKQMKPWNEEEMSRKYQYEPEKAFASPISMFALLASAFTRAPAVNSLNALAAGMEAVKAGDQAAYDRAHEAWKQNNDLMKERFEMEREHFQDGMSLMKTDFELGNAKLLAAAHQFEDKKAIFLLEHGMVPEFQKMWDDKITLQQKTDEAAQKLNSQKAEWDAFIAASKARKELMEAQKTGDSDKIAEAQRNYDDKRTTFSDVHSIVHGST